MNESALVFLLLFSLSHLILSSRVDLVAAHNLWSNISAVAIAVKDVIIGITPLGGIAIIEVLGHNEDIGQSVIRWLDEVARLAADDFFGCCDEVRVEYGRAGEECG